MKELLEIANALKTLGHKPCALATVIQVEGSAYRRPGARMLITPEGQSWGMISGGCLEHDVLSHARRVLQTGQPLTARYDSTSNDDIVFGTGLGCNGIIDVFIEPITDHFRSAFIEATGRCQTAREACALATVVAGGEAFGWSRRHAFAEQERWVGDERLTAVLNGFGSKGKKPAVLAGKAGDDEIRVFVQPLLAPLQLVVFGGWLDVVPLIRIAKETGFQVIVVDSRERDSSLKFFGEADAVLLCSPREALSQIQFDDRTVAVLMNHHFERDEEALAALTQVAVPFIGMLGPGRRKQRLLESIKNNGVTVAEAFEQSLHGPVGLDIGASTPEEIAVSIMAEILAALNGRNAKPIRDRLTPLHITTPSLAYA
ncbi:MAG TPA: XdhC family protein [Verrucomicrobiae bacterium]|nr:XdhC family protein [Verrucomicrobiae bacterium]